MTYRQPLTEEELPFLAGSHVTANKGTGLVHTAPAHGHDDFQLAMAHNIKIVCLLLKCNPLYSAGKEKTTYFSLLREKTSSKFSISQRNSTKIIEQQENSLDQSKKYSHQGRGQFHPYKKL